VKFKLSSRDLWLLLVPKPSYILSNSVQEMLREKLTVSQIVKISKKCSALYGIQILLPFMEDLSTGVYHEQDESKSHLTY
jgi:hypothetical protein